MKQKNLKTKCLPSADAKRNERKANAVRRKGELMRRIDLPEKTAGCVPCLNLSGDAMLEVENYAGILELTASVVRIYTGLGILRICGKNLLVRDADGEKLLIDGRICSILYEND